MISSNNRDLSIYTLGAFTFGKVAYDFSFQYSIDMGLKKMFKNGDAKGSVRRRRAGKESGKDDMDTDDEVENNCDKVGRPTNDLHPQKVAA